MTRDATVADADELCRLLTQLGYPTTPARIAATLPAASRDRGAVVIAESDNGGLAGFVAYQIVYFFEDAAPRCRITALAVDHQARRRGVGRTLLDEVEHRARACGCTEIEVSSARRPERDAAHRFYPVAGFADAAATSAFYSKRLDG